MRALLVSLAIAIPSLVFADTITPTMPVDEITRGLEVRVDTVFSGTEIESIAGHVVGVAKNGAGPNRDIILIELEGEKVRHTGIAHGMSGSPVYVGDRLIGALSLVLSPFPKDPIGGVTPIADMLREATFSGDSSRRGGMPSRTTTASRRVGQLQPITPALAVTGLHPEAMGLLRELFQPLGVDTVTAIAGTAGDPPLDGDSLVPGAAIAAILASGDMTIAATGTITHRSGDRLVAFGHPFLGVGGTSMPLAPVSIIDTLADQSYSYKIGNIGAAAGTMWSDRTSAIAGTVGEVPSTVPMRLRISGDASEPTLYEFAMVEDERLTPQVAHLLFANALLLRWHYVTDATYRFQAVVKLADGRSLEFGNSWVVAPEAGSAGPFLIASELAVVIAELYTNRFEQVDVDAIDLTLEVTSDGAIEKVDSLSVESGQLRAGDPARLRVVLTSRDGGRRIHESDVPIPSWASGKKLAIRVVDGVKLRGEIAAQGPARERATDLDQLLAILVDRPRSDRLFVQLVSAEAEPSIHHQRLPLLPPSVATVMAPTAGFRQLPRTVVWQGEIQLDGVGVGAKEIPIEVKP